MQVQAATDLADGGLEELEILGVAEPALEPVCDRVGAGPLPQARRQQGAQAGVSGERAAELGEVLAARPSRNDPAAADSGTTLAARWLRGVVMKPL